MADVTTMADMWVGLMAAPSVETPFCAVCGRTGHLERHHMVPRSAGRLFRGGVEVEKPTITLCGFGNAGGCHGLAHSGLLHFRWVATDAVGGGFGRYRRMECGDGGHLEYLLPREPVGRLAALSMPGWRRLRKVPETWA